MLSCISVCLSVCLLVCLVSCYFSVHLFVCLLGYNCMYVTSTPHPLTVAQALKFMMDLEDDSDWSLSDELEEEDSNRYN